MILIFARDPGAANVIAPLAAEFGDKHIALWAKDSARGTFKDLGVPFHDFNAEVLNQNLGEGDLEIIDSWLRPYNHIEMIFTGTSHFDDFTDRLLWKWAEIRGIKSIAVLDQWLRVRERFENRDGKVVARPSVALTPSKDLEGPLKDLEIPSKLLGHPHLENLSLKRSELFSRRKETREKLFEHFDLSPRKIILYASEPDRTLKKQNASFKDSSFDEVGLYETLRDSLKHSNLSPNLLLVKPHPKEDPVFYLSQNSFLLPTTIHRFDAMIASDLVVGFKSMFLIEACALGVPTISYDPWDNPADRLVTRTKGLTAYAKSASELSLLLKQWDQNHLSGPSEDHFSMTLGLNPSWISNWKEIRNDL